MPQSMKKLVPFLSVIVLLCASASALAQGTTSRDYPKFEIFAGYSALGDADAGLITFGPTASIGGDYTTPVGFEVSVIGNFSKYFGIKGDFSVHINNDSTRGAVTFCNPTCVTATQDFQLKTPVQFSRRPGIQSAKSYPLHPVRLRTCRRGAHHC